MATATYKHALRIAQQLTPDEQAQLIDALKATDARTSETGEGSTGAPLNEPQPYSSPRTSSEQ